MRLLIFVLVVFFVIKSPLAHSAEPFLKPGDVIALVGGEDMVVAAELGYLEALTLQALPQYKLKFRSLAWEGDTVFQQKRDLNYPSLEAQLDKIGATVVICQFGQVESLEGKDKVSDFSAAYEKLIARLSGGGKRRVAIIAPLGFDKDMEVTNRGGNRYSRNIAFELFLGERKARPAETVAAMKADLEKLAQKIGFVLIQPSGPPPSTKGYRDGIHQTDQLQRRIGQQTASTLRGGDTPDYQAAERATESLRRIIAAKNKLWFNYYRPQNWAFLAGDRTNQPSSRDHKDPSKRWFPEELDKFVPLIEAKEQEIWALADKLAKEGGAK